MFSWAKQQLANVAGTQEPIYGPSAIQSVTEQTKTVPYSEVTKNDLRWVAMESTCVETQTFYMTAESGHLGMAQVIYSNVAGIRTTCQFNTKIFYPGRSQPILWSTDPLTNYGFDDDRLSFHADNLAVTLSEDGNQFTIKSAVNENSIVHLTFTKTAPGFQAGHNGTSTFGTDPNLPWGSMRHVFWPRNRVEGTIITKTEELNFKGHGLFVHALQGMKPHHAAARWNFVEFQSPTYSAVMMEYVTPPSYGSTLVNVGAVARDGEIVLAGCSSSIKHTEVKGDPENDWPEPGAVSLQWAGKTKDGQEVQATMEGTLGDRLDRVDVMAEVPEFLKKIVGGVVGTRPYIYQFSVPMTLKINIGEETTEEKGVVLLEATFIS
ncbi:MAG: putative cell survival pathways protein [Watsoniomyces obsoletus]|nr:MAG: putative cell survival pathways protein [Watsoniomyces obsoletus]